MTRRKVHGVTGRIELADGTVLPVTAETLSYPAELALRLLAAAMIALAVALVLLRVT
jgi:hypothetical protein